MFEVTSDARARAGVRAARQLRADTLRAIFGRLIGRR